MKLRSTPEARETRPRFQPMLLLLTSGRGTISGSRAALQSSGSGGLLFPELVVGVRVLF